MSTGAASSEESHHGHQATAGLATANGQSLPPGWQEMVDHEGRTYYADHASRTTSYDRPEAQTAELLPGWELLRNRDGVAYYVDHNTRTTTFEDPRST